jgi:hypothetical protein
MEEVTDPEEVRQFQARQERFARNLAWLEAHASEVYSHRGKVFCIAGQELFVGDDPKEVRARARAAHPEDDGLFTQIVPQERGARIYANRRFVAPL